MLYAGLTGGGVALAWLAHVAWVAPARRSSPADEWARWEKQQQSQPAPADPADWMADPSGAADWVPLDGDPLGLAPPAEARRRWAMTRHRPRRGDQFARYEAPLDAADGADWYARQLESAGGTVFRAGASSRDPSVQLVIGRLNGARVIVRLRRSRGGERMTDIAVTALRE